MKTNQETKENQLEHINQRNSSAKETNSKKGIAIQMKRKIINTETNTEKQQQNKKQ